MSTTNALRSVRMSRPRLTARGVLDFIAALDARARARHHLLSMDEHMLRDIGVTRDDIRKELHKPLW